MRMFWITLLAYELVWLAAVVGAGHGRVWPGVAAAGVFAAWRLAASRLRRIELRLVAVTVAVALVLEGLWVGCGLIAYSAPWPLPNAPAWLIALWVAFALTLVPLFGHLHGRPKLAALMGAVGGPLAYAGAASAHALRFPTPPKDSLAAVSLGWAIALPLLTGLAARGLRNGAAGEAR